MKLIVFILAAVLPLSACIVPDHRRDGSPDQREHRDDHDHDRDHCDHDEHCDHGHGN